MVFIDVACPQIIRATLSGRTDRGEGRGTIWPCRPTDVLPYRLQALGTARESPPTFTLACLEGFEPQNF